MALGQVTHVITACIGFRVPGVNVRHATPEEDLDDGLGLRLGLACGSRPGGSRYRRDGGRRCVGPRTGAWGSNNPAVLNKLTRRASRRVIGRFNVMPKAPAVDYFARESCGVRIIIILNSHKPTMVSAGIRTLRC